MLFSTTPVVKECEEKLHENICKPFKISSIFAHVFWEKPAFAHTMFSKGFREMYHISMFPVAKFALVGIFHGQSFLFVHVSGFFI